MSAAIRRLMRRMFPDRRSANAVAFRRGFQALERRFGPFDDLLASCAAGVVAFDLKFQEATARVERARTKQTRGKGRRPSAVDVERLERRQGLSWQTFDAALRQLEERARRRPEAGGSSLADALREGE